MRILVTGGAGFIGSHLCEAYLNRGDEVLIIDDLTAGYKSNVPKDAKLFIQDISTEETYKKILEWKPELINHHAAQKSIKNSLDNPSLDAQTNILGTLNLLRATIESGCKLFIYASSGGAIYDSKQPPPYTEASPPLPASPYGVSKLSSEYYLQYFSKQFSLKTIALRYSNVYGPRQDLHGEAGVVSIFNNNLKKNLPVYINGSGNQTRDFIHIEDVVKANLLSEHSKSLHTNFNVGTGIETSIINLFEMLQVILKSTKPAEFKAMDQSDVARSSLDCSQIYNELGWKPEVKILDGLLKL